MAVEKKFVRDGLTKAQVDEHFNRQLVRAGYGGMEINRTPMGTKVTIFAEKPGIVIGKGGKSVRSLTDDLENVYGIESPEIDVQEVRKPELNAQMMASRLANSLERGWYFRKAGNSMLMRIMDSGALGCEIILSGKLTGSRSRVQKFLRGYIKHAGKPAEEIVNTGYAVAVKKLGTIGCKVKIVLPDAKLPDNFEMIPRVKSEAGAAASDVAEVTEVAKAAPEVVATPAKEVVSEPVGEVAAKEMPSGATTRLVGSTWEHTHDTHDWHPMGLVHADAAEVVAESPVAEAVAETKVETEAQPEAEIKKEADSEDSRTKDGTEEHKHEGHNYWHPASRVHKG